MDEHVISLGVDLDALELSCSCGGYIHVWELLPDGNHTLDKVIEASKRMPHKAIETTATETRGELTDG